MTKPDSAINTDELDRRARLKEGYDYEMRESEKAGQRHAYVTEHPLDRYHTGKTITERQYQAGDYLRVAFNGSNPLVCAQYDGVPPPDHYHPRTPAARQIEAANIYNTAVNQLRPRQSRVLKAFCCLGLPIEEIWKITSDRQRSRYIGRLCEMLEVLADVIGIQED